jgi:hypothetical protein
MVHDDDRGGFNIGDPVQLIGNPRRMGRVTAFTTPITSAASGTAVRMSYVVFPGSCLAQPYAAFAMRVCKCVTRIPKGVSRC